MEVNDMITKSYCTNTYTQGQSQYTGKIAFDE